MFTKRRIIISTIIIVIVLVVITHIVYQQETEKKRKVEWHNVTENPKVEQIEMTLNLVAVVEDAVSEEELGYTRERFISDNYWWQARGNMLYERIAERLGLTGEEYAYSFDEYYYVLSYGRP